MKTDRVPVLVDTNIWSEAVKTKADPGVIAWLQENEPLLYISTLTIGEIRFGIERLPPGKRKSSYQIWLSVLIGRMRGRVLSFNTSVATVWGQLLARCESNGIILPCIDGQLAATALRHSLILATRNEADFQHTGVKTVNPFSSTKGA
jgi:predicted nucleic acid-binding protein